MKQWHTFIKVELDWFISRFAEESGQGIGLTKNDDTSY